MTTQSLWSFPGRMKPLFGPIANLNVMGPRESRSMKERVTIQSDDSGDRSFASNFVLCSAAPRRHSYHLTEAHV